ncbi:MAG: DNA alkylation repair protein [Myxococcales bacterium]|nr:MAG: DNA alkylation repair protein [Myxococcales bacterium]
MASELDEIFRKAGRKERAVYEKRYLKSALEFYGTGVPFVRKQAKMFYKAHPDYSHDELWALVDVLWRKDNHELRSFCVALLELFSDRLLASDLSRIKSLLIQSAGWALVDWLATGVLSVMVQRYASARRSMKVWARHDNFWIRRSALLSLLSELRCGEGDFTYFEELAVPMLQEKEFFIRKAIGWILREVSKKNPDLSFGFLKRHRQTVSSLTLREGSKYLSPRQKQALNI